MENKIEKIVIRDAKIINRNFSGTPNKYNRNGARQFCVVIEDEDAAQNLINVGWNIKIRAPKADGDIPFYYLPVELSFKNERYKPQVYVITGRKKILCDENDVADLDRFEFEKVDILIRPRTWTDDDTGEKKVKAYVEELYITIGYSELASEYADFEVTANESNPFDD